MMARPALTSVRLPLNASLKAGRGLANSSATRNATRPAPAGRASPKPEQTLSASNHKPVQDARSKQLAEKLRAKRLEELQRATERKAPQQLWSNRTLIALATSVGACTFLFGNYHGYRAGEKHALEQIALGKTDQPDAQAPIALPTDATSSTRVTAQLLSLTSASLIGDTSFAAEMLSMVRHHATSLFSIPKVACEPATPARTPCKLIELVQYHCELQKTQIVCQPLDRIFRKCHGRPTVEVTHIVEFDETGAPYLPEHLAEAMPPSQHWHELRAPDI